MISIILGYCLTGLGKLTEPRNLTEPIRDSDFGDVSGSGDPGFREARSGIPVTNLELHIQPIWSRYIHIPTGPFDADIVDDMNYL